MQFEELKPLPQRFDEKLPHQGFDVRVFNESKCKAVCGSCKINVPEKDNIIRKGSKEAATITAKFKAHFGHDISSAPADEYV